MTDDSNEPVATPRLPEPPEAVADALRLLSERAAAAAARSNPGAAFKDSPAIENLLRRIAAQYPQALQEQIASLVAPARADWSRKAIIDARLQRSLPELLKFSAQAAASSTSDPKLYPERELDDADKATAPAPRKRNSPAAFFGKHAVTVNSIDEYLQVIATIQSNYSGYRLVWRGQQDVEWPVQSSLHRHLIEKEKVSATEENLVDYEKRAFGSAAQWGISTAPGMGFLSSLQHNGAPTRLLDISRDPNVASWFAVEWDKSLESKAARVIVWALDQNDRDLPTDSPDLFWHEWTTESLRREFDWGTGTSMWPWFPPAAGNERMRAQRAGFLLGASSIVTKPVADLYSEYFDEDWNTTEIANATSFLGVPVPHDRRPGDAPDIPLDLRSYVPFVTIHIPARVKRKLRIHLEETAGLNAAAIYPDLAGLIRELRTPPRA
ncbi:FRG domain-containing protein [Microbacterium phyllosphaerae]|uniref:FRG domain-containing protein n=1 Tax=Microbacterium phyllosphaerae TaxID=124798 RepID=UPI003D65D9B0